MADDDSDDDSQKTEEPSQRKLDEAAKKGQIFSSKEINNWMMILSTFFLAFIFAPIIGKWSFNGLATFLQNAGDFHADNFETGPIMTDGLFLIIKLLAIPLCLASLAAIIGQLIQVGGKMSLENLVPKLERVSPLSGLKRIFSMNSFVDFIKGIIKMAITGSIVFAILWPEVKKINLFTGADLITGLSEIQSLLVKILLSILSVLFLIAILDYLYQRFAFMKKMRMSHQEIKEEFKQTEGDPLIKSKVRQMQQERSRQRMMQAVPTADVIITNPEHYAIALKYEELRNTAPVLVAKGVDRIALRIREIAKEHKVPIVENPPLARALYANVDLDEEIPEDYYKAVAKIISYVYGLKKKR